MRRKLIYLSFIRLTDKVSRDWYIDYSLEKGAEVEYWDIVSLVREEHVERGALDSEYLRDIKSYTEFEALLRVPENTEAVYVMLISYSGHFSKLFRMLTKYHCKMVFISWGAMPTVAPSPKWRRIIRRLFLNPVDFVKTVFDVISGIAYRKLNLVKRFDIVFAAGSALTSVDQYAKRVVPFNLCDFDHYSRVQLTNVKTVQGKYAVFLDINLPFQSDLAISGLPAVKATSYFKSLNRFFDLLEKTYDVKVVIAAHPKASYFSNEFMQRETYRLLTAELVRDAEYVITHTSTALSYAVLNLKPILFIYTDEMMRIYRNTLMREMKGVALYLNTCVYNIDRISNGNQIIIQTPNHDRYDSYKYGYLTSHESEQLSSAEIFLQEISAL